MITCPYEASSGQSSDLSLMSAALFTAVAPWHLLVVPRVIIFSHLD